MGRYTVSSPIRAGYEEIGERRNAQLVAMARDIGVYSRVYPSVPQIFQRIADGTLTERQAQVVKKYAINNAVRGMGASDKTMKFIRPVYFGAGDEGERRWDDIRRLAGILGLTYNGWPSFKLLAFKIAGGQLDEAQANIVEEFSMRNEPNSTVPPCLRDVLDENQQRVLVKEVERTGRSMHDIVADMAGAWLEDHTYTVYLAHLPDKPNTFAAGCRKSGLPSKLDGELVMQIETLHPYETMNLIGMSGVAHVTEIPTGGRPVQAWVISDNAFAESLKTVETHDELATLVERYNGTN